MNKIFLYHHSIYKYKQSSEINAIKFSADRSDVLLSTAQHNNHDKDCKRLFKNNCDIEKIKHYHNSEDDIEFVDFYNRIYRVRNCRLHCEFGPAIVGVRGYGSGGAYFLNGKKLTFETWLRRVKGNKYWPQIIATLLSDDHY